MTGNSLKAFILFGCLITLSSCGYQEYDSNNPWEYINYWCNPNNFDGDTIDRTVNGAYNDSCDRAKNWFKEPHNNSK